MKDRFSDIAGNYAAFRPTYPGALYQFIYSQLNTFETAWDAGTGNGQVAVDLAARFKNVLATDISEKQIANSSPAKGIVYRLGGEETDAPDSSIDLITVAQAIHWFDRDLFYREVRRVARPNAVLAVWGYGLVRINEHIDPLLDDFYTRVIGPFWDPERRLIDERYSTIAFPFEEVRAPAFAITVSWTFQEYLGYLNTWSAVQNYIHERGVNPVDELAEQLDPRWKEGARNAVFPLFMRVGRL